MPNLEDTSLPLVDLLGEVDIWKYPYHPDLREELQAAVRRALAGLRVDVNSDLIPLLESARERGLRFEAGGGRGVYLYLKDDPRAGEVGVGGIIPPNSVTIESMLGPIGIRWEQQLLSLLVSRIIDYPEDPDAPAGDVEDDDGFASDPEGWA